MQKRLTILGIFAAICALGVPVWWRTTSIFRAPLPITQMLSASPATLPKPRCEIAIIGNSDHSKEIVKTVSESTGNIDVTSLGIKGDRELADKIVLSKPKDVEKLLSTISSTSSGFKVFVVESYDGKERAFIGKNRTAWMISGQNRGNLAKTVSKVCQIMSCVEGEETKDEPKKRTEVKGVSEFTVSFTLLNEDPESVVASWDFAGIAANFIMPMLEKLSPVARFRVESQVLHFTDIGVEPRKEGNSSYVVDVESLSQLLDSDEWNIDTATTEPTINMVILVPAPKHSPLHIAGSGTDGFIFPGWGGIIVHNLVTTSTEASEGPRRYKFGAEDLTREMTIAVSQLRELIGISNKHLSKSKKGGPIEIMYEGSGGILEWEIDGLVRRKAMENSKEAAKTLSTFASLLESSRYMRVLERTRELIEGSLHHLEQFSKHAETGDCRAALGASQLALKESEEAFFDRNVLALLYFPDEHKYAIYVPLFVPIGIQLTTAFWRELKHRWWHN